jgi:hypothetical protein
VLAYEVFKSDAREFDFRIVNEQSRAPAGVLNYPLVDIRAIRDDLKARGFTDAEADAFIRKHLTR